MMVITYLGNREMSENLLFLAS